MRRERRLGDLRGGRFRMNRGRRRSVATASLAPVPLRSPPFRPRPSTQARTLRPSQTAVRRHPKRRARPQAGRLPRGAGSRARTSDVGGRRQRGDLDRPLLLDGFRPRRRGRDARAFRPIGGRRSGLSVPARPPTREPCWRFLRSRDSPARPSAREGPAHSCERRRLRAPGASARPRVMRSPLRVRLTASNSSFGAVWLRSSSTRNGIEPARSDAPTSRLARLTSRSPNGSGKLAPMDGES